MKKIYEKLIEVLTSNRMKSLYWRSASMIFAGFSGMIIDILTSYHPDGYEVVFAGLIFGEITKFLNTK